MHRGGHDEGRERLRLLDRCLEHLEEAHERDQAMVSEQVAARVQSEVPAVQTGMLIRDAINVVLTEQEQYLNGDYAVASPFAHEPWQGRPAGRDRCTRADGADQVCRTPAVPVAVRGSPAAGVAGSWLYFMGPVRGGSAGLSRTRSYELLDQGRVLRAVTAAAGISAIPDISAYAAQQLKPFLPELIEAIRQRTSWS